MHISSQLNVSLFISSDVNISEPFSTHRSTGQSVLPSKSRLIFPATLSMAFSICSFGMNGLKDLSNNLTLLIALMVLY